MVAVPVEPGVAEEFVEVRAAGRQYDTVGTQQIAYRKSALLTFTANMSHNDISNTFANTTN